MNNLENRFDIEMMNIYRRALKECGYNAHYFLQMLYEKRGLKTAKDLLHAPLPQDGFNALYNLNRLNLTVEALLLRDPWNQLFTESELVEARKRLKDRGYS